MDTDSTKIKRRGISVAARKSKGRNLQKLVVNKLLEKYKQLEPDDITSRSMGANGEDLLLSPAARKLIPYSFECKNIAAFVGYTYLGQAESNCPKNAIPIAVVKNNHKKPVVVMYFDDWLKGI